MGHGFHDWLVAQFSPQKNPKDWFSIISSTVGIIEPPPKKQPDDCVTLLYTNIDVENKHHFNHFQSIPRSFSEGNQGFSTSMILFHGITRPGKHTKNY